MFYRLHLIMAILQIGICVYLLFRVLPKFIFQAEEGSTPLDSTIRNWLTMGGFLVLAVFVLTVSKLYDIISLWFLLLSVPVVRKIWRYHKEWGGWSANKWIKNSAMEAVYFVEQKRDWRSILKKLYKAIADEWKKSGFSTLAALLVATSALVIRIVPAYWHAAPFSRVWFDDLSRVNALLRHHYFIGGPSPGGLYSLISVFSFSARLSPDLLLHIFGALTIALLCLEIYWSLVYMTDSTSAALFGMLLFALFPTTIMPQLLETQVEANSLLLAICFALPTLILLFRRIQNRKESIIPLIMGVAATGFTNTFILIEFLLPVFLVVLFYVLIQWNKKGIKAVVVLIGVGIATQIPFIMVSLIKGDSVAYYLLSQLFATQSIGIYDQLLLPLNKLGLIYGLSAAGYVILVLLTHLLFSKKSPKRRTNNLLMNTLMAGVTGAISLLYIFPSSMISSWIDVDQLAPVYSVMIALLSGLFMGWVISIIRFLSHENSHFPEGTGYFLGGILTVFLLLFQGGIRFSTMLPRTEPDGFYKAFYRIINDNLPYTYAIVAPPIDKVQADQRSYFMDYNYFLEQYSELDSLYATQKKQRFLSVVDKPQRVTLPASIFLMIENPDQKTIQPGILDHQQKIMRQMSLWLHRYQEKPGHIVKTYYHDSEVKVVELINEPGASKISDVLWHVEPDN